MAVKLPLSTFTRTCDPVKIIGTSGRNSQTTLIDEVYLRTLYDQNFRYIYRKYMNKGRIVRTQKQFSINGKGLCRRVFLEKFNNLNN